MLNDQSSLYADATGQGSVVAAQMAAQDYMEANPNSKLKIEITFADHQNKPDIGANIARQWFEREGVDIILDVPNSSVALAVSGVARQLNKVMVNGSAGSARLTGDRCRVPNTVHWTFDNYALSTGHRPRGGRAAFADLGRDVTHLDCVRGQFFAAAGVVVTNASPARSSEPGILRKPHDDRICSSMHEQHR